MNPAHPLAVAQDIIHTTSPCDDSNVRRAAHSLNSFWPDYCNDDLPTGLADLLCDLRHLCDLAGYSLAEIEQRAHGMYLQELAECGGVAVHADLAASIKFHLE